MSDEKHTNRLAHETSPYLLQHAHNPVDWYPWGKEALEVSRAQGKPIFLSIGYSACHWCHVMERESFENPATAQVMNELFINVKVDREERPDLDQIYMTATQLITQHGGWPMSVWLTPDLKPFYAGTYFPPEPRHGMPAFVTICRYLSDAWMNRRQEVLEAADDVTRRVDLQNQVTAGSDMPTTSMIKESARELERYFDRRYGGLGTAPKFPHSTELRLLLRAAARTKDHDYRSLVELTLDHMIRGGIYDQLGGGFHRYSVDAHWLVPHFEKMLYDNALIPLACHEAAQATEDPALRQSFSNAVEETLNYVLREMTSPEGPFYSTQDADSEGEEGKFFVWSRAEVIGELGEDLGSTFCYAYDVSEGGNWEHSNILHLAKPMDQTAKLLGITEEDLSRRLKVGREKLFEVRSKRIAPGRDEKVLTSWNGMMIDTLAVVDGGRRGPYAQAAINAANFLLNKMRTPEGKLYRTYKDGRSRLNGYLEDYSYLANGLVSLYEATFDRRWIDEALAVVGVMIDEFWDEEDGGFFYTGKTHEELIARGKDPHDGAIPSGNSMAATALARLTKLTGREDLFEKTDRTLRLFSGVMKQSPMAAAQMMIALSIHQGPTREIVLVGDPHSNDVQDGLAILRNRFIPDKVVALRRPGVSEEEIGSIALLAGKKESGSGLTTYICENFTCQEPLQGAQALGNVLDDAL
ncbi:thioredoxin domain-containing protein [bacterium]|nr:thioredoxin domain-containing protein [bacterium]